MKKLTLLFLAVLFAAQAASAQQMTRRQRFDRGLAFDTHTPHLPKGLWITGISGNYSEHDNDDYGIAILEKLNSTGNTMFVSPMVQYAFANNQSAGIRFSYRHSLFDMDNVSLTLGDLTQELFGDGGLRYRYENDSFMGLAIYRYYVGLGNSRRILFFNEIQAGIGGGTGREDTGRTDAGGYKNSTHHHTLDLQLGFSPGATFFVTNAAAIELQIGLLGYQYRRVTQESVSAATTPGEIGAAPVKSSRVTHNASAKFNLLSIAFGATFYL